MKHRLSAINPETKTADCEVCGSTAIVRRKQKNGDGWRCATAREQQRQREKRRDLPSWKKYAKRHDLERYKPYRVHLKQTCERCGFVPEHECQLDVDHKDQDHQNNDPSNLQTLCANCHRLKTWAERNGVDFRTL